MFRASSKKISRISFQKLFKSRQNSISQNVFRLYGNLAPLQKPIFVIGLNRSGTTIFTNYLSQSSEIANWSEANEVWDPIGYPYEAAKIKRPFWPVDPQGYTKSVIESVSQSYFQAIPGIFAMFAYVNSNSLKTRFLNKSPMNTLRIELIHNLFPNACFVSIVRDPRAVVRSWAEKIVPKLNNHPFSSVEVAEGGATIFNVDGVQYSWHEMLKVLSQSYSYIVTQQLKQFDNLPNKRTYYTCYEDFVGRVHGVLGEIDRKFGLDSEKRDWSLIPESLENRNLKFTKEFAATEIDLVVSQCKPIMEKLGYEITN